MTTLPALDDPMVDKSLSEHRIPASLLGQLRHINQFSSHDFQVDGVFAVYEDGHHSSNPIAVRPKFEWRKYATPTLGLRWRRIPVDDSDEYDAKLDPALLAKQTRMTQRAQEAYGNEEDFIVSEVDRENLSKERTDKLTRFMRDQSEDLERRAEAAKLLQARARRRLLDPLYPWYHVARLAMFAPPTHSHHKKSKSHSSRQSRWLGDHSNSMAPPLPDLPWCSCWTSLEATFELSARATQHLRQILSEFEAGEFETCLRRIDNMIAQCSRKKSSPAIDHVMVELVALCNRFGMRLFFLGRMEHAHTFFSRVLGCTHMNAPSPFDGKAELYSWTCDLVAYCLWTQGKYEEAHWTLSRSASLGDTFPFNAGLVTHIHACQLLLKLEKPDLVIRLGAKVLFQLLQARHERAVAKLLRQDVSPGQILQIVEHAEERGIQIHSPTYINLLCHAAQTVAFALAKKGRYGDAKTVSELVLGETKRSEGASNDIRNCAQDFLVWIPQMQEAEQMLQTQSSLSFDEASPVLPRAKGATVIPRYTPSPALGRSGGPVHQAQWKTRSMPALPGSPSRSFASGGDEPPMARVSVGSVAFEPSSESSWAPEFFGDIYWQRHTEKRSQVFAGGTQRSRPPFR